MYGCIMCVASEHLHDVATTSRLGDLRGRGRGARRRREVLARLVDLEQQRLEELRANKRAQKQTRYTVYVTHIECINVHNTF